MMDVETLDAPSMNANDEPMNRRRKTMNTMPDPFGPSPGGPPEKEVPCGAGKLADIVYILLFPWYKFLSVPFFQKGQTVDAADPGSLFLPAKSH